MMLLASARDDPYYRLQMLLVQAPWTVASPEYQGGPYFSGKMPSLLGVGSSLSESSSLASSLLVATTSSSRPVPAKLAFMCFCKAKGMEICNRNEVSLKPLGLG
jgi:hypothetical protein